MNYMDLNLEVERADRRWGRPASSHETLGVLLEEFNEFEQAVHANDLEAARREALQVAAVAMRFVLHRTVREDRENIEPV
ncbi:MAG: hypothetical protein GY725_03345 [bacterium]|nr:hypothetical protein [bacterium]